MVTPELVSFSEFYRHPVEFPHGSSDAYIGEITGKDSIAAVLQVADRATNPNSIQNLLGIGVYHHSFYGNALEPIEHFQFLEKFFLQNIRTPLTAAFLYLDVAFLFDQLILRTMATVQKHFGLFSPCPPCHLFFHMMRIPIARHYGITQFISGERETHGTRLKFNQLPGILTLLQDLLAQEGITLVQSIRSISDDEKIFALLGSSWQSADPYRCSLSGNYYDEQGKIPFHETAMIWALREFYYPLFHRVINYIEAEHKEPSGEWIQEAIKQVVQLVR